MGNPVLPELESGEYLASMLCALGYVEAGMNGPERVSWQELRAWQEATRTELTPWEAETLISLSGEYAAMYRKAKERATPSPLDVQTEAWLEDQNSRVDDWFDSL